MCYMLNGELPELRTAWDADVADLLNLHICYQPEFGRSTSKAVGVSI